MSVSVTAWGCACILGSNLLTVSKAEGKCPHKAPSYRRCNLTPKRNLKKTPTTVLINTALTNICWSRFKFRMYCIFTIDLCAPTYHISQETTQYSTKAMSCQLGRIIINEIHESHLFNCQKRTHKSTRYQVASAYNSKWISKDRHSYLEIQYCYTGVTVLL